MKWYYLIIMMFLGVFTSVQAQDVDDDMYFVPSKKKATKTSSKPATSNPVTPSVVKPVVSADPDANVDYHTGRRL